jgi:hypothetical protein
VVIVVTNSMPLARIATMSFAPSSESKCRSTVSCRINMVTSLPSARSTPASSTAM